MAEDIGKLIEKRSLPVALRGYDRAATEALLGEIEQSLKAVLAERNELRATVADLGKRASDAREQEQAISDALVAATRIRSESEREAKEAKAGHMREVEAIKAEARQRADESVQAAEAKAEGIVRAAEARAEEIVEAARWKSHELGEELESLNSLADQTRGRLTSFLESLLAQVEHADGGSASLTDDLLDEVDAAKDAEPSPTRAGQGIEKAGLPRAPGQT